MMSRPSAPYYYKENRSDVYHWETSCSTNQYPAPGWIKRNTPPAGSEQCNECKAKGDLPFDATAPAIEDVLADLAHEIPEEDWKRLPPDLTDNLDHYLYGTPKQ